LLFAFVFPHATVAVSDAWLNARVRSALKFFLVPFSSKKKDWRSIFHTLSLPSLKLGQSPGPVAR
jgi:hypothetical protein